MLTQKTFMNLEQVRTASKILSVILDAKYKKENLNKVMNTQYQHQTETQRNEFLNLLQKSEEMFGGTLDN